MQFALPDPADRAGSLELGFFGGGGRKSYRGRLTLPL
jgi:hypothetical protein